MLQIITIICVTHGQKNFWIRASIKKLLTKYQIFTILPQISHFHKFRNFSSIFATFETNCFILINFMAGTSSGIHHLGFSDHSLVYLTGKNKKVKLPPKIVKTYSLKNKLTMTLLTQKTNINWDDVMNFVTI